VSGRIKLPSVDLIAFSSGVDHVCCGRFWCETGAVRAVSLYARSMEGSCAYAPLGARLPDRPFGPEQLGWHGAGLCPCRESNPTVLMVQSAQDRMADNASDCLGGAPISARPCSMTGECACRCISPCTTAAPGADGVGQISRYDQCIPCGSNRSAVLHIRFAMGNAATSADHECPLIELFGRRSHHRPDPVCTENPKSDHSGDEVRPGWRVN
jgi:hypothetical protein